MSATITKPKPPAAPKSGGPGSGNGPDFGGGGNGGDPRAPVPPGASQLGMALGLASVTMLFIGLTSAYIVRQGLGGDWQPVAMPPLVWLNTALLVASSVTMEKARRLASRRGPDVAGACARWLGATLGLGLLFLGGQLLVWQGLSAAGVYLSTSAHSSFLYLLTALHGLHVLGGLLALAWVALRSRSLAAASGFAATARPELADSRLERWLDTSALYWHFMDVLWIYLVVLLFAWR